MAEEKEVTVEEQVESLVSTFAEEQDSLREFFNRVGKEHAIKKYNINAYSPKFLHKSAPLIGSSSALYP